MGNGSWGKEWARLWPRPSGRLGQRESDPRPPISQPASNDVQPRVLFPSIRAARRWTPLAVPWSLPNNIPVGCGCYSVVKEEEGAMHDAAAVARLLEAGPACTSSRPAMACEVIERQGKPAFVIGDVADEITPMLIVMGTNPLWGGASASSRAKESTASAVTSWPPVRCWWCPDGACRSTRPPRVPIPAGQWPQCLRPGDSVVFRAYAKAGRQAPTSSWPSGTW